MKSIALRPQQSRPAPPALAADAEPLPHFVQIEPVGQCNLRCRMCPIQFRTDGTPDHPPAFMSFDVFCRLIDQFPSLTELHLQGMGEPLMHPRFFDMVRYAARRGIEVSTNSNLTLLSERRADECVKSGLRRIHVSLDGATARTYEAIRVGAHHDRVLRNVRRLIDARRQLKGTLPEVHLVAVAMKRNLEELPQLVELTHSLGANALSVQHLCHDFGEEALPARYLPMRAFVEQQTLLNEDRVRVADYFARARAAAAMLDVSLRLPGNGVHADPTLASGAPHPAATPASGRPSGRSRCDWPWRGTYISFNGEAMPCCIVATPDRISFGNMEREGAAQVWNNAAYVDFRRRLDEGPPPDVCRSCAIYAGTF